MNTNRFETFYDAILAIIITILVLKISEPINPTWGGFFSNYLDFITYIIVFLSIINIWYSNQKLFQHIDYIDNRALLAYGSSIFLFTLFPYFAKYVALNIYSLTAETVFGLLILFTNLSHIISVIAIFGANKSNEKLKELNIKRSHYIFPIIVTLIGFIISYTIFIPGIYITSLFAVALSIIYNRKQGKEIENTERFEALIDAIIAIIITIIVIEIPLAANGNLDALFEIKLDLIAYAISFIVCFKIWNLSCNLFSIVKKINYKAIWAISVSLLFLSFIPYLTNFVANNFNEFVPQCLYGLDFIMINIGFIVATIEMKKIDKTNSFLQESIKNYNAGIIHILFTIIFIIIGYFYKPSFIIISCLLSLIITWIMMLKKINLLGFK